MIGESILLQLLILIVVALVIWYALERFSPDEFITKAGKAILFGVVLYLLIKKLWPFLH